MTKIRLSEEQKSQINKRSADTLQQIKQAQDSSNLYQKQLHMEADAIIKEINQEVESYKNNAELLAEQRGEIINDLQEKVASGDINAASLLLKKLS